MFAVTPRLLLRPGWAEDAEAVYSAITDEKIVRNLGSAPWPYSFSDAQHFLSLQRLALHPNFLIFLRDGQTPQLIGSIGFGIMEAGILEIGYWVARDYWSCGYATEAGKAVLETARSLGHYKMHAEHYVDNPASGRVLEKLGFQRTGRIAPRYSKGRGGKVDAVQFILDLKKSDRACDVMRPIAA